MRQQWIVAIASIIVLVALYIFGRTKPYPKGDTNTPGGTASSVNITDKILAEAKKQLSPDQLARITTLENSISRGDVKTQKIELYAQLANFWRDSMKLDPPYLWYLGEKAKLENT